MNATRATNLMTLSLEAARAGQMTEAFGLFLEGFANLPPEAPDTETASCDPRIGKAIEDAATRECTYNFECAAEELVGLPACAPGTDCPSQGKSAAPAADDVEEAPQSSNDVTVSPPTPADAAPAAGGGEAASVAAGPSLRTRFRRLAIGAN